MSGVTKIPGRCRYVWVLPVAFMLAITLMPLPAFAQQTGTSDDDFIDDDSQTNITIVDNSEDNDQVCAPIINQYNNITQGGANALAGGDAVANVANKADVSNSAVVNCINGDGNGSNGGDAVAGVTSAAETQYTPQEEMDESQASEETPDGGVANSARSADLSDDFCSAGTTLRAQEFDQDDEDGVTFTADENGFLVTLNNLGGDSGSGMAGVAGLTLEYGEDDQDDQQIILTGKGDQKVVNESGDFTLNVSDDVSDDATYEVTVSYCVEEADEGNDLESSVMDGTYDKNATLAKTGGQTSGVLASGGASAVAIPAGALLLVVCATFAVVLHGQYRRG